MNFIRFVKTPRISSPLTKKPNDKGVTKKAAKTQLSMILATTTDFSLFAGSAELRCQLVTRDNSILSEQQAQWVGSDREIKVDFSISLGVHEARVIITPVSGGFQSTNGLFLSKFLGGQSTHLVGVETDSFSLNVERRIDTVYRRFILPLGSLQIAEQAGETIIRHVWDAGIFLSAAITYSSFSVLPDELQKFVGPLFEKVDCSMRILELGAGVGILGISISSAFPNIQVVLTDLPDAQLLIDDNIRINASQHTQLKNNASFRTLDWEQRPFPPWTTTERFDLIVMADVTYNTATFMALADTLEHLFRTGSKGAKAVCCGKRRHEEEEGFWQIVKDRGFILQMRVTFAVDLEGNIRYCGSDEKLEGEQMVDFISMTLN